MYGWYLLPRFVQNVVLSTFQLSFLKVSTLEARRTLSKPWHLTELHLKNGAIVSALWSSDKKKRDKL